MDQFIAKYGKFIVSLHDQISNNFKEIGIQTRSTKSQGLWCYILLPVILIMSTVVHKTSPLYQIITFISVGLFFYGSLFILFLSISSAIMKESFYGGCIASSLITTLLIYTFTGKDLLPSLVCSLPCIYFFNALVKLSLVKFPNTFTIGEAMVVAQGLTLFAAGSTLKFIQDLLNGVQEEYAFINNIIFIGLSTLGLIVTALFYMNDKNRTFKSLHFIVVTGVAIMLIALHCVMGSRFFFMIYDYIFDDIERVELLAFWLSLVVLSVIVLYITTKMAAKANTVMRKTFHLFASLVFLSGILVDTRFMSLAAGVGLGLMLFVEALRKSGIEPVSSTLQSAVDTYGDEKIGLSGFLMIPHFIFLQDSGAFAMTPLYLYAGLACPLVLVPETARLELLSGILAVGIGDTAASVAGTTIGRTKWPDSNRTLEGTAFNVLSQLGVVYTLQLFDLLQTKHALIRTFVAASASALTEAKTDQVDNLILPLVTILAFQTTWFLS